MNSPFKDINKKMLPRLTPNQQRFVDLMTSGNPISPTRAAMQAYGLTLPNSGSVTAHRLLRNVKVLSHLDEANDMVESVLSGAVSDWGRSDNTRKREIALDTAKFIHDKIHGKATVKVESSSVTTNITIDLSGGSAGPVPSTMLDK